MPSPSTVQVVSVRHIHVDGLVPVFDATMPKHNNYCLADGTVVHNTAINARDIRHQEILKLKGKPLNGLKASLADLLKNEVTSTILTALGVDLKSLDVKADKPAFAVDKLRVRNLILLADADADGPLHPSTPVLTLDGKNPTIGQLAKEWEANGKPVQVYSRDVDGNLVVGDAIAPRITCYKKKALRLHFSDGTVRECTHNHKWMLADGSYVAASKLRIGDGLNSLYLSRKTMNAASVTDYLHIVGEEGTKHIDRKAMPVHQFVKSCQDPAKFARYRKANAGRIGSKVHIHHKDHDPFNNSPDNLAYVDASKHYGIHGREMATAYNGSRKHKADVMRYYLSSEGKQKIEQFRAARIAYNKSDANRESTAAMNRRPDVRRLQLLSKCSKLYVALLRMGVRVTPAVWNNASSWLNVPRWSCTTEMFSKSELRMYAVNRGTKLPKIHGYMLRRRNVRTYPTQAIQKFVNVCLLAIQEFGKLTETTYNKVRAIREVRGDLRWDTGLSMCKCADVVELRKFLRSWQPSNHTITKIVGVTYKKPQPYYCLTVPEYGNFMVADANGNGICSSNCHINVLILALVFRLLPDLMRQGRVFVVRAPLYNAIVQGKHYGGATFDECYSQLPKGTPKTAVIRAKGWGEVSTEVLDVVAFNYDSRFLSKIQYPTTHERELWFKAIVAEDAAARRSLLGLN